MHRRRRGETLQALFHCHSGKGVNGVSGAEGSLTVQLWRGTEAQGTRSRPVRLVQETANQKCHALLHPCEARTKSAAKRKL